MADNIKIDLLINAAQSAKTIQETKKALKDLKSEALNLTEGTAAFTKVATAAGQLQDKIGDLSATTKYLGDDLRNIKAITGIGQGIAAGFAIASGAAALFGGENKKLQESMVKLQAIMAVMQGMEQIGAVLQKQSAAVLGIKNAVTKTAIFLTSEQAVAEAAEAVAAGTATVAQRALNAAMNANPIGILITLILAGVAALSLWGGKTKELTEEQKALNKTLLDMRTNSEVELKTFNSQIEALKGLKTGSEERAIAIKKINDQYGTTLKNLSDENAFLIQVKIAQDDYVEGSKRRLLAKMNESKVEALYTAAQKQREEGGRIASIKAEIASIKQQHYFNEEFRKADLSHWNEQLVGEAAKNDKIAKSYEAQADKLLNINAEMMTAETAAQKAERLKQEAATKKADDDKIEADKKTAADNIKAAKATAAQLLKDKQEAWKKEQELKKAHQDILDNLEKYIYETNNEYLSLTYEAYVSAYDKELALLELTKDEKIKAQNELLAAQLKAIEDGIKKDLDALGLYGAAYDKEFKIRLTKATTAGTVYAAAVNSTNQLVVAITETSEKERTRIVDEENKKRLELSRKATEIILSKDDYKNFTEFQLGVERAVTKRTLDASEFGIRRAGNFIDAIKNIFKRSDSVTITRPLNMVQMRQFTEDMDINEKELSPIITRTIKDFLSLKDGIETSLGQSDEGNNMLLKIYTDKFQIIKEQEEKINAERQRLATQEKPAVPFSVAGAGKSGIEGLTNEERSSLEAELTKRYDGIIIARKSIFDSEIKGLYTDYKKDYDSIESSTEPTKKKNKRKEELNTEYFKKIEKLTDENEDALLVIGRAYGKVSDEELNEYHKRKLAKKKAQSDKEKVLQQKLNDELLQLEMAAQAATLSIFNNQMDLRAKANQKAYDGKIALIDAEENAYKNAQANRTTLQQAQYDTELGFAEQRKNAERVRQLEEDKIKKKQFNAQKINDAATVAINTGVAVSKTIAELGGVGALTPPGIALIAAMIAGGAIQETSILSKKYIPTYATGGLVNGPGTGTSDSIDARLSNGESVINAKSTSMFAPMLSAINQAGGGVAIPHTKSNIFTPNALTSGGLDTDGIINAINELNNRPIETYVKEVAVTNSQNRADKLKRRTSF